MIMPSRIISTQLVLNKYFSLGGGIRLLSLVV